MPNYTRTITRSRLAIDVSQYTQYYCNAKIIYKAASDNQDTSSQK